MVWLLIPPVIYVGGVGYYFSKLQGISPADFIPHLGLGYLLFRFLMTIIMESASVLPANSSFILDGHARLTDFVLRVIAKGIFYLGVSIPVIIVALAISPQLQVAGFITVIPALVLVVVNVLWMGVIISLFGARFPDINELMSSIFIFGFILTPILWMASAAPVGTIHGTFMRVNPLFHMIEIVRAPLLGEHIELFTYVYMVAMTISGWTITAWIFKRYSRFVPLWV